MKSAIEAAQTEAARVQAAIWAVPGVYIQCPGFPTDYTLTAADRLLHVFCRHSKRTMYYALNVTKRLLSLRTYLLRDIAVGQSALVPIDDEVFFDFDAFAFSAKSIFSGTILKASKSLHNEVQPLFVEMASRAKRELLDPTLDVIRNEVVHLNNVGSGFGSTAMLTNAGDSWKVEIRTAFHTADGRDVELIGLFLALLGKTCGFVMEALGLLLLHVFRQFGKPDRNVGYVSGGVEIRLSDFKIPGMNFV